MYIIASEYSDVVSDICASSINRDKHNSIRTIPVADPAINTNRYSMENSANSEWSVAPQTLRSPISRPRMRRRLIKRVR